MSKPLGTSYLDYCADKLQISYGDTQHDYEMWRTAREAQNAQLAAAGTCSLLGDERGGLSGLCAEPLRPTETPIFQGGWTFQGEEDPLTQCRPDEDWKAKHKDEAYVADGGRSPSYQNSLESLTKNIVDYFKRKKPSRS